MKINSLLKLFWFVLFKDKLGLALKKTGRNINKIISYLYSMSKKKKINITLPNDKNIVTYDKAKLEKMTIESLRVLAKQHKINLQKKRIKVDIVNIMFSFFLQLKSSDMDTNILPTNFDVIIDSENNINISL